MNIQGECMDKVAVYPGSFDPITNGHLDLIERALRVFDKIIIAVAINPAKKALFEIEERLELIEVSIQDHPLRSRIGVDSFTGLLVDYVQRIKADAIVRGLRAVSDFEYEFQMALMNRRLNRDVETLYLMTGMRWIYISSRIIKEVAGAGGCLEGLVHPVVEAKLHERLRPAQGMGEFGA
jgi:pantetheine-phosphate adenylyltransferase